MTRAALPLFSLALGVVLTSAVRVSSPAPSHGRHSAVASGAIARALGVGRLGRNDSGPIDERAEARRRLEQESSGTYIDDILAERDSSLARWPDRPAEPLRVWIQSRADIKDFDSNYPEEVREAFESWDNLHLPVRFAFVADSADADVHVTWIDRFSEPISGRTRWSRDDDWLITDANIVLALHHHRGEQLDYDAMYAMALHEVGHLLGLDHTQDTLSIMAPKVRVRALSDADRATARLVYALPPGPIR